MDTNMVIDLLHAICCQCDTVSITLDGKSYDIEEICCEAIRILEDGE